MEESLDIVKLTKLFNNMYSSKVDVEFSDDEVKDFNEYIRNNNVDSIVQFFEFKENMGVEVFKDMIYSKIDSLWQYIMDESYKKWEDGCDRDEFLNKLTDYEKTAVMFGNFNYHVENGGLYQWHENNYSDDLGYLYNFLDNCDCDYDDKNKFMQVLDDFSYIKTAIEELNRNDDWYEEDCQTRLKSLKYYYKDYFAIQESWKNYFERYLVDNIPDEYIKKITELNEDIKI